jgi:phosphoglycolate phosphatase-like HAD superfamily hydrolase
MSADNWSNNAIQFPRLIAEAEAAGLFADNPEGFKALCESMDLEPGEVCEIIDRAQDVYAANVARIICRKTANA